MLEEIKTLFSQVFPDTDFSGLTEDKRLIEDLGFDSLSMMMLAMAIEEAFHFKFASFVRFETVGDVCGYLECRV